jgi:hypothetical protein
MSHLYEKEEIEKIAKQIIKKINLLLERNKLKIKNGEPLSQNDRLEILKFRNALSECNRKYCQL